MVLCGRVECRLQAIGQLHCSCNEHLGVVLAGRKGRVRRVSDEGGGREKAPKGADRCFKDVHPARHVPAELVLDPVARLFVLVFEAEEDERVEGVDDGVADALALLAAEV